MVMGPPIDFVTTSKIEIWARDCAPSADATTNPSLMIETTNTTTPSGGHHFHTKCATLVTTLDRGDSSNFTTAGVSGSGDCSHFASSMLPRRSTSSVSPILDSPDIVLPFASFAASIQRLRPSLSANHSKIAIRCVQDVEASLSWT
jgi:hypothetical protein